MAANKNGQALDFYSLSFLGKFTSIVLRPTPFFRGLAKAKPKDVIKFYAAIIFAALTVQLALNLPAAIHEPLFSAPPLFILFAALPSLFQIFLRLAAEPALLDEFFKMSGGRQMLGQSYAAIFAASSVTSVFGAVGMLASSVINSPYIFAAFAIAALIYSLFLSVVAFSQISGVRMRKSIVPVIAAKIAVFILLTAFTVLLFEFYPMFAASLV